MKFINTIDLDFAFLAFSSLFSIINPISAAPIFVSLTDSPGIDRKKSAWRTSLSAGLALALFALAGGAIFAFFGITIAAFQIAGGILFSIMSIQVLLSDKADKMEDSPNQADPSIVPLGIPLIAGPGAISTVMILVGQARDPFHQIALASAIVLNIVLTLLILLASPWIVTKMGATGQRIVAKVMGLITAVIGVQFIINGSTKVVVDILKSARG